MCEHQHQTSMKLINNKKNCSLFLSFFLIIFWFFFFFVNVLSIRTHSFLGFQWIATDTMNFEDRSFLVLGISAFFSLFLVVVSSIINEHVLFKLKRKKQKVFCYCLRAMRITFMSSFCINNTEYGKNKKNASKRERERERGKENMEMNFAIFFEHGL